MQDKSILEQEFVRMNEVCRKGKEEITLLLDTLGSYASKLKIRNFDIALLQGSGVENSSPNHVNLRNLNLTIVHPEEIVKIKKLIEDIKESKVLNILKEYNICQIWYIKGIFVLPILNVSAHFLGSKFLYSINYMSFDHMQLLCSKRALICVGFIGLGISQFFKPPKRDFDCTKLKGIISDDLLDQLSNIPGI